MFSSRATVDQDEAAQRQDIGSLGDLSAISIAAPIVAAPRSDCERLTDLPTIRKPKQRQKQDQQQEPEIDQDLQADEQHDTFLVGSVFPATASTATVYHSVKGKEVWGLIWDPGAADGLLGTHTLLE